jgi:predicted ArsR family transcriptional regulator
MLHQLLVLIEKGEQFSHVELAEKLDVNPSLISNMLQQLMELGYLENLDCKTYDHYNGCPSKSQCCSNMLKHVWTLTSKGHRVAHNDGSM